MAGKKWTEEDIDFIRQNVDKMNRSEIAAAINRTTKSVNHVCFNLGIKEKELEVGDKIHFLTITKKFIAEKYGQNHTFINCLCDCGKSIENKRLANIVSGKTKSCGCWKRKCAQEKTGSKNNSYKHGLTNSRLYSIWYGMKSRCHNQYQPAYKDYGLRGISVCQEWRDDFVKFYDWAMSNGYGEDLTLDRVDNNGNYEPSNCRWATREEQSWNRRNNIKIKIEAFGESKSPHEWIEDDRCPYLEVTTLLYRLGSGWDTEIAITKPSERKNKISK